MNNESLGELIDFLGAHEREIAMGVGGFGFLDAVYLDVMGQKPQERNEWRRDKKDA